MKEFLELLGDWPLDHPVAWTALRTTAVLLAAWASFRVARTVLLRWIGRLIRTTRTRLDDVLLENDVLRRTALLAPVVVISYGIEVFPGPTQELLQVVNAGFCVVLLLIVGAGINAFQDAIF